MSTAPATPNIDAPDSPNSPATVQYPSGHTVQFPSEAHAQANASSVWGQLKDEWNKVSNFQGVEGADGADRQGSAFGQSVIDKVKGWHKTVNNALGEAGAELGRKPAELVSGVKNIQAYMPSPYGQKPAMESMEATAQREHPTMSGVGEGVGKFAGSMLAPENVAIMAAMPYAKAVPLLTKGLSVAFAAGMGKGVLDDAKNLVANWSTMTPQQRTSSLTSGSLQTVMAGLATMHAVGSEGKVTTPSALKGDSGALTLPDGSPKPTFDTVSGRDENGDPNHVISINHGGESVGHLNISQKTPDSWTINDATVKPGMQGKGLGSAGYEEAFKQAADSGMKTVESDISTSKPAARTWRSLMAKHPDAITEDDGQFTADTSKFASPPVREMTASDKAAAAGAPDVNDKGQNLGVKPIDVTDATGKWPTSPDDVRNDRGQILGVRPPVEDIGGKVRAEAPAMPRGERRAHARTPEEEHSANAFKQAFKELGSDATDEQIDSRMAELGVSSSKLPTRMGSGIPEILKRLKNDETGSMVIPGTGQGKLPFGGDLLPDEDEPDAPLWYSHAADTIDSKVQNNMTGDQVRGVLINAGVKPDEFTGTGLDKYLEGKNKVSKPELQQFMQENQLKLRELTYGGPEDVERTKMMRQHKALATEQDKLWETVRNASYEGTSPVGPADLIRESPEQQMQHLNAMSPETRSTALRFLQVEQDRSDVSEKATGLKIKINPDETESAGGNQMFDVVNPKNGLTMYTGDRSGVNSYMSEHLAQTAPERTKYPDWVLGKQWSSEGGLKAGDYAEKLLMLPEKGAGPERVERASKAYTDFIDQMRRQHGTERPWYADLTPEENATKERLVDEQNAATKQQNQEQQASYTAPHFRSSGTDSTKNIVAHARYGSLPEMTDKRTMILHETQSDWNTDIRSKGYRGEKDELTKQAADLYKKQAQQIAIGDGSPDQKAIATAQATVNDFKSRLQNGEKFTAEETSDFRAAQAKVRQLQAKGVAPAFTSDDQKMLDRLEARQQTLKDAADAGDSPVANGPLIGNWHELVMKRMLREAVDKGYERMVWPTGEQQADLYGLHHHIADLTYDPYKKDLHIKKHDGTTDTRGVEPTVHSLKDWMGEDLAKKMVDKINQFKDDHGDPGEPDEDAMSDEQLYDQMAEPYSVDQDEQDPEYVVDYSDHGGDTEYFDTHRAAERHLAKWWEKEHPYHDPETGYWNKPEAGEEERTDDDNHEDIDPPTIGENEREPSYSLSRDGEHIDSFESEREAERARERAISDDVENYDGPRSGDSGDRADKSEWPKLSGLDLHHGGEFHKLLYDTMLPSFLKKYTQKWGGKVGMTDVPNAARPKLEYAGPDISLDKLKNEPTSATPNMKIDSYQQEIVDRMEKNKQTFSQAVNSLLSEKESDGSISDHGALGDIVKHFGGGLKNTPQSAPMHSIEITPQMKRALSKGKGQKISKNEKNQPFASEEQDA